MWIPLEAPAKSFCRASQIDIKIVHVTRTFARLFLSESAFVIA